MLAVEKVAISFAGRTLFKDLSFALGAKDRVALVGPNGAGKSMLLKVIAGVVSPDDGRINAAKYIKVGYLPQEGVKLEGQSLFAEAEAAYEDVVALQEELDAAGDKLGELDSASEEYKDALDVFGELQLRLEHHDIPGMKLRIERILGGLGFAAADFKRDTKEFSGGWQMRIALAKLLLREPSVLLLDEPTNHLDLDSQLWLENYLREYNGSIVMISHDRAFLDALIDKTFAFHAGRVEEYAGNYSFFEREHVQRREVLERAYRNQQKDLKRGYDYVNRFRATARRASGAQSRLKALDKVERIELEPEDDGSINFRFPPPSRSGLIVAKARKLTKCYGDLTVFKDFDFEIQRGDRVAIVGVNGAGKSTFSRILVGAEEISSGERMLGHSVVASHFAQNHAEELDPNLTVLGTVEAAAPPKVELNLRTLLGCFLFRGDDVFKHVAVLSGGERSRLALARMLLEPTNFLVLDEPTNHLDMKSQEVLQNALANYEGTFAIVSHNRAFLDPITTKVLEFRSDGRPPQLYLGNVTDYLEKKACDEGTTVSAAAFEGQGKALSAPRATETSASVGSRSKGGASRKEEKRKEAEARQERAAMLKPLKAKLEEIEASIAGIEARRGEVEKMMEDPEFFRGKGKDFVAEIAKEYSESAGKLESAYFEWSEVSEEIEGSGG